jgi:hypothetical protein
MKMLAEERLSRIMKLLSQQRTATVQELCVKSVKPGVSHLQISLSAVIAWTAPPLSGTMIRPLV